MAQVSKKKLRKAEEIKNYRIQKFQEMLTVYERYTLEELKNIYNHPDKNKRPGGIYREALIEIVRRKQIEEVNRVIAAEPVESTTIEQATVEINNSEQSEEPQQSN